MHANHTARSRPLVVTRPSRSSRQRPLMARGGTGKDERGDGEAEQGSPGLFSVRAVRGTRERVEYYTEGMLPCADYFVLCGSRPGVHDAGL